MRASGDADVDTAPSARSSKISGYPAADPVESQTYEGESAQAYTSESLRLDEFGYVAGGWTSQTRFPRELADVNGDGRADIIGFGNGGVSVALATAGGGFAKSVVTLTAYGATDGVGGWSSNDRYPRQVADVNGDGRADIVGFGNSGVYVSLSTGGGNFANPQLRLNAFGDGVGGWSSNDRYLRELADVNGDGMADIVGFGEHGVYLSLATGGGSFANPLFASDAFGAGGGWGWSSNDRYPRKLADVNGDGRADIVGFGVEGVYIALALGGSAAGFTTPVLSLTAFGSGASAGSWTSNDRYPREVADVNGDGKADIVGFGENGVYISFATEGGNFASPILSFSGFGAGGGSGGWTSNDRYPRTLADVDGDDRADILGFGNSGVYVALATSGSAAYAINEPAASNETRSEATALDRSRFTVASDSNLPNDALPSARVSGTISTATDVDYYKVTLSAGELLILDIDGTTTLDALVKVFGENGSLIAENDDLVSFDPGSTAHVGISHNMDSYVQFRAPVSGTYYIGVQAYTDATQSSTGAYTLNVSVGPVGTAAQIQQENIDALTSGAVWGTLNLTYSYPTLATQYETGSATDERDTFQPLLTAQKTAVGTILTYIASLTNLSFTQVTTNPGTAELRFARTGDGETAHAYYPGSGDGGDAWFNATSGDFDNPVRGNYAWATFLHESGHALGLKHGHESPALSPDQNSIEFSVMTYASYVGSNTTDDAGFSNEQFGFPTTFMMYDIAALQQMYGADYGLNSGNSVYTWSPTTGAFSINGATQWTPGANRVFMTVWDGGGVDTYDFSNYPHSSMISGLSIDLRPGQFTVLSSEQKANLGDGRFARGHIANALMFNDDPRSLIENAIGSAGFDTIIGNDVSNRLTGGANSDRFTFFTVPQSSVSAPDSITDFKGEDRINLEGIDANSAGGSDNDSFNFIGSAAFTAQAGQLRSQQVGADLHLLGDVNGDGAADLQIILLGVSSINASQQLTL